MSGTITVVCPSCKRGMRASAQYIGRKGRCPECKALVDIVPAGDPTRSSPTAAAGGPRPETKESAGTHANQLLAGLFGAAATVLLYGLVFYPLRLCRPGSLGRYLGDLMTDRGLIQHSITFVTCWGLSILVLKYLAVRRERRAADLELTLVPLEIGLQITPGNVEQFLDHLGQLPQASRQSLLTRRLQGALEHFKYRHNVSEVQTYLASQAEIEASGVDSGYTLLRTFIWVCPILGFIGTVMGISDGVTGLKGAVAAMTAAAPGADSFQGQMMQGMQEVTNGLSIAFDTTLLGLLCVVLLMFPCETLRKTEYAMLDRIEEFANESLLRRLAEGQGTADAGAEMPQVVRQTLDAAFKEHQRWLAQWQAEVGKLGQTVGTDFAAQAYALAERLGQAEAARMQNAERIARAVETSAQQAAEVVQSWQRLVTAELPASLRAVEQVSQALNANAALLSQWMAQQRQTLEAPIPIGARDTLSPVSLARPERSGFFGRLLGRNHREIASS
jgi:biopolymer transport protein ExbB/TolQ